MGLNLPIRRAFRTVRQKGYTMVTPDTDTTATTDQVYRVPVKGGGVVEVDSSKITSDEVYRAIFAEGLKVMLGVGMSKETKTTHDGDAEALKASCLKIAEANLAKLYAGKATKRVAKAKSKIPAAVKTMAMYFARLAVKQAIKDNGDRVTDYTAKQITSLAEDLILADPSFIEKATTALAEAAPTTEIKVDKSKLKPDAEKVAKNKALAEKKAKEKAMILSAAQAGKVVPKAQYAKH